MKSINIIWHLGLGDAIVCAPIVAKLATNLKVDINVPCWEHNLTSVKSFFIHFDKVNVYPIKEEKEMYLNNGGTEFKLGYYNTEDPQLPNEDFIQWFYRQAGMDLSDKAKYCPLQKAAKEVEQHGSMPNLIHDDHNRGFIIKDVQGWRIYHDPQELDLSILAWTKNLETMSDIHCIDSSFLHLAESFPTNAKLHYHKYARHGSTDYKSLTKNWEIIE